MVSCAMTKAILELTDFTDKLTGWAFERMKKRKRC